MEKQRPKGITIIGALEMIGGILILLVGIFLFVGIPLLSRKELNFDYSSPEVQIITGPFRYLLAAGFTALGITSLFVGFGLLKGKPWAWKASVIITLISIGSNTITIAINSYSNLAGSVIGIIIDVIILYYLYRPHVKVFFGRSAEPSRPADA